MDQIISRLQGNLETIHINSDTLETLLSLELNVPPETLLEDVFVKMREITVKYSKAIRENKLINNPFSIKPLGNFYY